jgi:hypothetical protein
MAILDDGATTLTITNRGRATVYKTNTSADINIASSGSARIYADETDEIIIYDGLAKFKGNEGAPISVGGLYIYGGGTANTRTGSATFSMPVAAARMYGGRLLLDPTTNTAIA